MARVQRLFLTSALVAVAVAAAGCGGDGETAREVAQRSVSEGVPPLEKTLITQRDLDSVPAGSAERAFLTFWRDLQFQAWDRALATYEPQLVRAVDGSNLVEALKSQGAYFRRVKPEFQSTIKDGDTATVRYLVESPSGPKTPQSVSFQRRRAGWSIVYDPFLDVALLEAIQAATQAQIDPRAQEVSARAIQAGLRAARLQSSYLALKSPRSKRTEPSEPRTSDADAEQP